MSTFDIVQRYGALLTSLGTDLISILVFSGLLYFRRHWRADLLLSYVALNIGIFVTMALLTQVKIDIAVGFGLFAILSIVRLRSSAVTQQEVAYYFLALVLGLINGLGVPDRGLVVLLNIVLLLAMWVFDSRWLRERSQRMDIKLEGVYTNGPALTTELERQLGSRVVYFEVTEIDLIHNHMLVDVRLRPGEGVVVPPHEKHGHHQGSEAGAPGVGATGPATPSGGGGAGARYDGGPQHSA